jgi:GxxExxY protein
MKLDELTEIIIGLAIKIHRNLGPGLLESVYQAALAYELQKACIPFEKEKNYRYIMRTFYLISDFVVIFLLIKALL